MQSITRRAWERASRAYAIIFNRWRASRMEEVKQLRQVAQGIARSSVRGWIQKALQALQPDVATISGEDMRTLSLSEILDNFGTPPKRLQEKESNEKAQALGAGTGRSPVPRGF